MDVTTSNENKVNKPDPATGSASDYNKTKKDFAVMSGKGGAGKSFVTGILATSLAFEKVGTKPVKENTWAFAGAIDELKKPLITSDAVEIDHDIAFSEVARQLIRRKENMGCFEKPDAGGKVTGWCGDTMEIHLMLDGDTIKDARFMTDGCGATIACGSMLTKMARSKLLSEAMKISPDDLLTELISIPEDHEHCLSLAVSTLRAAVNNAMEKQNATNL